MSRATNDNGLIFPYFNIMEIEHKTISYQIVYSRGKDSQKTTVLGVKEEKDLVRLIRNTFSGRFKCPVALKPSDGVRIILKKLDHIDKKISFVMSTRIYNKSVRQARIELEQSIKKS